MVLTILVYAPSPESALNSFSGLMLRCAELLSFNDIWKKAYPLQLQLIKVSTACFARLGCQANVLKKFQQKQLNSPSGLPAVSIGCGMLLRFPPRCVVSLYAIRQLLCLNLGIAPYQWWVTLIQYNTYPTHKAFRGLIKALAESFSRKRSVLLFFPFSHIFTCLSNKLWEYPNKKQERGMD